MNTLKTPNRRFLNLKDYPFTPHYVEIDNLAMHYVDEGPADGAVILMLHGEPSWSYLYRHMIPLCAAAGNRVIAPDLIGFGKSDKPVKMADYSYQGHVEWMLGFIDALKLKQITLVCQDWGSLIGLRIAAEHSELFAGVIVGNGMLPTGTMKMPKVFKWWKRFATWSPWFPIDKIVDSGCFKKLDDAEKKAYRAPFPSSKYKAGTRAFPKLVPVDFDDPESIRNREAWELLKQWEKPFLTTFSNGDPIMRGGDKYIQKNIPGCQNQPHQTLKGGHFLQEDSPQEFSQAINDFVLSMQNIE